jgi:ribosomal protein S18 acetylase RimI-like enzyme
MYKLQPARLEDDSFLYEVYASTRIEELALTGWPEQEVDKFLRMQYEIQKRSYLNQYPLAAYELVILGNIRIGRMMTVETETAWLLVDAALLPVYRNQGLGGQLINDFQQKAAAAGKSVRLHVLEGSPARRLYARHGFRITGQQFPYVTMEWISDEGQCRTTANYTMGEGHSK